MLACGKQSVRLPWHLLHSLRISAKVVSISLRLLRLWMSDASIDGMYYPGPSRFPTNKAWFVGTEKIKSDSYVLRTLFFMANMVDASFFSGFA